MSYDRKRGPVPRMKEKPLHRRMLDLNVGPITGMRLGPPPPIKVDPAKAPEAMKRARAKALHRDLPVDGASLGGKKIPLRRGK